MSTLHIYTDGACSGNPGPGGAAAVAVLGHDTLRFWQGYRRTTNNRMELAAIILALRNAKDDLVEAHDSITIHTDSQVAYGGLALGWKRKANLDLWNEIDALLRDLGKNGVTVTFEKVKGHAGEEWNELADKLAVAARTMDSPIDDGGYQPAASYQPNLFDDSPEGKGDPRADEVRAYLAAAAQDATGSAYALLASMFAHRELSLERLAAEIAKRLA